MHRSLLPACLSVLFLAGATHSVTAQSTAEKLRPNIVHVVNANGEDEYRDDRISLREDTTVCFIYVGQKQSGPYWLRLQVRYSGRRRLEMNEIIFKKDVRQLSIKVMPELLHFGDNGMITWEWYDTPPSENEIKAIRAIINEPGVQLTLVGAKETVTRELSEQERLAMYNMAEQAMQMARP